MSLVDILLALAAFVTAIGGIAATIAALRKRPTEEHEECLEHLKECRAEAEKLAEELHKIKMQENET